MKKTNGAYFPEEVCASILGNLILPKYGKGSFDNDWRYFVILF